MSRRRRVGRWFERAVLGTVMSVIAFVIERRVLKAIRKQGEEPSRGHDLATAVPHGEGGGL